MVSNGVRSNLANRVILGLGLLSAAAPPSQEGGQQQYDVSVSRVRVDVIVTDRDGRFVDDLVASDFLLFEDGEPQQILEIQLVNGERGVPLAQDAQAAANEATIGEPGAPQSLAPGAIVFLIDGLNTGRRTRSRFAREWAADLEGSEPFAIPRAAFLLDYLGNLHELAPISREPEVLYRAAERVYGEPIKSTSIDPEFADLARMMSPPFDPVTSASRTYDALTALSDALAASPGRKAMIWVSEGLSLLNTGPQPFRMGAFPGIENDRRIKARQQAFHDAANTAGVSVYGLDPQLVIWGRSIGGGSVTSRSRGPVDRILAEARGPGAMRWDDEKDALIQTARATGGRAFPYATHIDDALRVIEADATRHYLLTYATPLPLADGRYHEVRVEVRNPDLDVRARAGYLDLSPEGRQQRALQANMRSSLALGEFTVVARAYRRWDPAGRPVVQIAATAVDSAGQPDNTWEWFHAVAFDRNGTAVDQAHLPVDTSDVTTQAAVLEDPDWPFIFVHDLAVPTGAHELTVALVRETGGRVAATDLRVDVPEEAAWQTSDLILAVRDPTDSLPSRPLLDGRVRPGEVVVAYVEVRGGIQPVLTGRVRGADAIESTQLPAAELAPDRVGVHRGALQFGLDRPGAYLLELTVVDEGLGERALVAELEVVAGR